jgi:tetratricopeptide (TPR) repeat protein
MGRISFTKVQLSNGNADVINEEKGVIKNKRIGFTDMKLSGSVETDKQKEKFEKKKSSKAELSLKDSIFFKTDIEYEEYLYGVLEKEGLFDKLYEQFKVFLMSKSDVVGLEKIWKYSEDLNMEPCDLLLEKADVLRQISRMDLAFDYLEQASRLFPENAMVNYSMAMYYKLNRDYELAMHWMNRWLVTDDANPEVYYQLGSTLNRMGSHDLAADKLRSCLVLDPNHLTAKSLLDKII